MSGMTAQTIFNALIGIALVLLSFGFLDCLEKNSALEQRITKHEQHAHSDCSRIHVLELKMDEYFVPVKKVPKRHK